MLTSKLIRKTSRFFFLASMAVSPTALWAVDAIHVDSSAQVGVGTNSPGAALHVYRNDGTAMVRVEEQSAVAAKRTLYNLINNGQVRFSMEDSSTSRSWDFLLADNGFNISLVGSGGAEFVVRDNGGLVVGPGGAANLLLTSSGNLFLAGSLTESSSRSTKTDITEADSAVVLAKLERLPIAEWRYKASSPQDRHLGPMAEDFHALFGLGPDNKHISPKDLAGVALAAVKAVQAENKALRAELEELKASLRSLEGTLQERQGNDAGE